jgi:predicted transcriptional regulator
MFKYAGIYQTNTPSAWGLLRMEKAERVAYHSSIPTPRLEALTPQARGRFDLMASILTVAKDESKQTRIMYKCNLSYRQLKVYMSFLSNRGLLELDEIERGRSKVRFFKTTDKGLTFLEAYKDLIESLKEG